MKKKKKWRTSVCRFIFLRFYVSLNWNHKTVWPLKNMMSVREENTRLSKCCRRRWKTSEKKSTIETNSINCTDAKSKGYSILFCLSPFDQWDSMFFSLSLSLFAHIDFISFFFDFNHCLDERNLSFTHLFIYSNLKCHFCLFNTLKARRANLFSLFTWEMTLAIFLSFLLFLSAHTHTHTWSLLN